MMDWDRCLGAWGCRLSSSLGPSLGWFFQGWSPSGRGCRRQISLQLRESAGKMQKGPLGCCCMQQLGQERGAQSSYCLRTGGDQR